MSFGGSLALLFSGPFSFSFLAGGSTPGSPGSAPPPPSVWLSGSPPPSVASGSGPSAQLFPWANW